MRVLVAGRWGPGTGPTAALSTLARGFAEVRPAWDIDLVPFGPGRAAAETMASAPERGLAPIIVGIEEETTRRAGEETLAALRAGLIPVVEGGHNIDVDAGLGFLSVISGVEIAPGPALENDLRAALERARRGVAGRDLIAAASTSRPLLGLSSVLAMGVDLEPRLSQDRDLTAALARVMAALGPARPCLPQAGSRPASSESVFVMDPTRQSGSGAAGGAAAMIAAIGGRIVSTGDLEVDVARVRERLAQADLVIVAEPMLHSPLLADSPLDALTRAATEDALPVVAVGIESSLSAHEAAEWGLHGVILIGANEAGLVDGGHRVARTWTRS